MEIQVKVTLANMEEVEGQLAKLIASARDRIEAGEDGEPEPEEPEVECSTVEIDGVKHKVLGSVEDPDRA